MITKNLRGIYDDREYDLRALIEETNTETEDYVRELRQSLLSRMEDIHEICSTSEGKTRWRKHTRKRHILARAPALIRASCYWTSQAYCKFLEILSRYPDLLPETCKSHSKLRSFHICEGPGNFIAALDRYLNTFYPHIEWTWKSNTLNPYHENSSSVDKLLDDTLIVGHIRNWDFGPDGSGDIHKFDEEYLRNSVSQKFNLVTADGSIYVQDLPEEQEVRVQDLIRSEVNCALNLLEPGGSFVLKTYTMYDRHTRDIIQKLSSHFDECSYFKPLCSKSSNSEKYLVCRGFRSQPVAELQCSDEKLWECEVIFTSLQARSIESNLLSFEDDNFTEKADKKVIDYFLRLINYKEICRPIRESRLEMDIDGTRAPWRRMYGSNLVERLAEISTREITVQCFEMCKKTHTTSSMDYKSDIYPTEGLDFLDLDTKEILDDKIVLFSRESIAANHSMFIDPVILHSLNIIDKKLYSDIFASASAWNRDGDSIISPAYKSCRESLLIDCSSLKCFQEVLQLLRVIIDENLEYVVFECNNSMRPMILSRFSASLFSITRILFREVSFQIDESTGIIFRRPVEAETGAKVRSYLSRLEEVLAQSTESDGFVRSFVPLSLFSLSHESIVQFNNRQMLNINI